MRTFLFILLAGLLGACSDDGELNGAVEAIIWNCRRMN